MADRNEQAQMFLKQKLAKVKQEENKLKAMLAGQTTLRKQVTANEAQIEYVKSRTAELGLAILDITEQIGKQREIIQILKDMKLPKPTVVQNKAPVEKPKVETKGITESTAEKKEVENDPDGTPSQTSPV